MLHVFIIQNVLGKNQSIGDPREPFSFYTEGEHLPQDRNSVDQIPSLGIW